MFKKSKLKTEQDAELEQLRIAHDEVLTAAITKASSHDLIAELQECLRQ